MVTLYECSIFSTYFVETITSFIIQFVQNKQSRSFSDAVIDNNEEIVIISTNQPQPLTDLSSDESGEDFEIKSKIGRTIDHYHNFLFLI